MSSSSWFGCLWSQIVHVVEKLRQGFVESGGEYFGIIAFEIYLLKCSFFAVIGFSKCKSLYLSKSKNVTGDRYAYLIHIRW